MPRPDQVPEDQQVVTFQAPRVLVADFDARARARALSRAGLLRQLMLSATDRHNDPAA
jgi:hypothetical protein